MALPRPSDRAPSPSLAGHGLPPGPQFRIPGAGPNGGLRIDWDDWLRAIERKRRAIARTAGGAQADGSAPPVSEAFYARATQASFRIDGLAAADAEVAQAMSPGASGKACRSRQSQRIRNHVATLRHAQLLLRRGQPLQPDHVVRWYTSISCGLSTAALDDATRTRLAAVVTRVNSPQMRLRPAVEDVAQLHHRLLVEPFVPAFNGILARVLLYYHLSRCGLPAVLFDPETDRTPFGDESVVTRRLMQLITLRYDDLLAT